MKRNQIVWSILVFTVLIGCVTKQVILEKAKPVVDVKSEIKKIISENPQCTQYGWGNRGKAPTDYVEHVAMGAHRRSCKLYVKSEGSPDKDALSWYGAEPGIANQFALLLGLGMRESSGRVCTGRDGSAENVTSSTAEAGLFQSSYNSMGASEELGKIYSNYKAHPELCEKKIDCLTKNWGAGEGVTFQALSKNCPAFAVDYNAELIRVLRKHFGPLNRKEAELIPSCAVMFEKISQIPCS